MAVRAHYPPNVLLLGRDETDTKNNEMDTNLISRPLLDQSHQHVFFSSNGDNANRRMRGREAAAPSAPPSQQQIFFSSMQSAPAMLDPSQLQSQTPPLVSTGLRLSLDQQMNSQIKIEQPDSLIPANYFSDELLAAQINKENNDVDLYLAARGEQLRRAMAERHTRHYRTLLETAGKKLLEKDAELERTGRCKSELEDRLTRIQTELMAWQAKAMEDQAAAASLQAQLQKASAAAAEAAARAAAEAAARAEQQHAGSPAAEDAESRFVDPNRSEIPERACRSCLRRPAMVVLLPCCHLCLCVSCDFSSTVGEGCPSCGCFRTGSLQVSFA